MNGHEIYMWAGKREQLLHRHSFYMEQAEKRLLSQFDDIEGEAVLHEQEYYHCLSEAADEHYGLDRVYEQARDEGHQFCDMLKEMQRQTILNVLAGCFYQWETDLRAFIDRELTKEVEEECVHRLAWENNISKVFDMLLDFGWDIRRCDFFEKLDAMRLIINVHKHGKGNSLKDLRVKHPQYIQPTYDFMTPNLGPSKLDLHTLAVSKSEYLDLAGACQAFWEQMPERNLYQLDFGGTSD